MKLQYKKTHPDAKISKTHQSDAGYDIHLTEDVVINHETMIIDTGLRVAIPENHVGLLFLRSSAGIKKHLRMANHVGVIDADYRGNIGLAVYSQSSILATLIDLIKNTFKGFKNEVGHFHETKLEKGERIAQLVIVPFANFETELVDELPETVRGTGGIGSTGN